MPLQFTPNALDEINRRAERLKGAKPIVIVYWERDSMNTRRTPTGQTEWYVERPGFWEVALQPLDEFPPEVRNNPALHTVAGYAVLGEDKNKVPITERFILDFANGQFSLHPPCHAD
jgi:hypothetical protein